jgi:hypothetical protein
LRVEFEFDADQRLLQQSVRETLAKTRALPEEELWATYTELGWLEAPPVELAIVLDELGYVADATPFLATATWFAPLTGRLPEGSGTGVFDGAGRFVLDADRPTRSPCSPAKAFRWSAARRLIQNGSWLSTRGCTLLT